MPCPCSIARPSTHSTLVWGINSLLIQKNEVNQWPVRIFGKNSQSPSAGSPGPLLALPQKNTWCVGVSAWFLGPSARFGDACARWWSVPHLPPACTQHPGLHFRTPPCLLGISRCSKKNSFLVHYQDRIV